MACRDQSYAIPCRRYKAGDPREEGFCPTNAAGLCCFLLLANGSNAPQCCCRGGGRRVTTAAAPWAVIKWDGSSSQRSPWSSVGT